MKKILIVVCLLFFVMPAYATSDYTVKGVRNSEIPINDAWTDEYNAFNVIIVSRDAASGLGTGIRVGTVTLDAGGSITGINLSSDSIAVMKVTISARPNNTSPVYFSSSSAMVTSINRFVLAVSDDPVTLEVDNVQDIWVSMDVPGEGVNWVGITR